MSITTQDFIAHAEYVVATNWSKAFTILMLAKDSASGNARKTLLYPAVAKVSEYALDQIGKEGETSWYALRRKIYEQLNVMEQRVYEFGLPAKKEESIIRGIKEKRQNVYAAICDQQMKTLQELVHEKQYKLAWVKSQEILQTAAQTGMQTLPADFTALYLKALNMLYESHMSGEEQLDLFCVFTQ